jgi:hypothetical protein
MANSRLVIKGQVTNSLTQVGGVNFTRYGNNNVEYGTVPAGSYTKGDYFYFGTIPSKKIIYGIFSTLDATPVVVNIGPNFSLSTVISITQSTSGGSIGFTYVIFYDSNFSGAPGKVVTLQAN